MKPKHGDKRDYPKIDIFIKRPHEKHYIYHCSTNWFRTCREAKQFIANPAYDIKANFAK